MEEKNRSGDSGSRDRQTQPGSSKEAIGDGDRCRSPAETADKAEAIRESAQQSRDAGKLFDSIDDRCASGDDGATRTDFGDAVVPPRIPAVLGDFRILRPIGAGGMGAVYEAEQISLKRRVALKLLPPHLSLSDSAVRKFRREAEAGGRQSHPGIVAVHGVGVENGIHYIAQELVEGGDTLQRRLDEVRRTGEPPQGYFREMAALIAATADALAHAHASGVVHRDVKPSNILLASGNHPKVTDFGLARVEKALSLSRSGEFAGTPYYMSPEQARGQRDRIDQRTDVYSLGVTLYEALTLNLPFEGDSTHEIIRKIVSHEPRDPRRLSGRVPRDLAVICLKAMEKDPSRRYENMADFSADLHRFLQGEMILARPAGPATRLWKQVKRKPGLSAASSVAVVALAALIVAVSSSFVSTKVAEQKTKTLQEVTYFLDTILAAPHPGVEGKDAKVVDVLARATAEIENAFPDEPEIEAYLRNTIGSTYMGLGLLAEAKPHIEKALEIYLQLKGVEDRTTLRVQTNLAELMAQGGELHDAESLLRRTLETQQRLLGDHNEDTLVTMNNLGVTLSNLGRSDESEVLLRECYANRQELLGPQHESTLDSMTSLGVVLRHQGELAEAEVLLRRCAEAYERNMGEEHPRTLIAMNNLADFLTMRGELSEAESLLSRALEISTRTLGADHPDTLLVMNNLADMIRAAGRYAEAEELIRQVIEATRRKHGDEHPDTLAARDILVTVLIRRRSFIEAETEVREVLELRQRLLGDDNKSTINTKNNLAIILMNQEKVTEAEGQIREVLESTSRVFGEGNLDTITAMNNLGSILADRGNLPESCFWLRKALAGNIELFGLEHMKTLTAKANLADTLRRLGEFAEAECHFQECLEISPRVFGEYHPQNLQIADGLAILYLDQGRNAEAEPLLREVVETSAKVFAPDQLERVFHHLHYGECLFKLKNYADAEPHLLLAYEKMDVLRGEEDCCTLMAARYLTALYIDWGKPDKAADYRALLQAHLESTAQGQ